MKALTANQRDERDDLQNRLASSRASLEAAVDEYNTLVDEATNWMTHLAETARDYYDARSEKWQEGDTGAAYERWLNAMEEDLNYAELSGVEADEAIANVEDAPS